MEQFCTLLWAILAGLAAAVSVGVSWLLDNIPGLRQWWEARAAFVKALLYAGITVLLGAAAWAAGRYLLPCEGWPPDLDIWYIIAVAAASWFAGGKRHEAQKALYSRAVATAQADKDSEA